MHTGQYGQSRAVIKISQKCSNYICKQIWRYYNKFLVNFLTIAKDTTVDFQSDNSQCCNSSLSTRVHSESDISKAALSNRVDTSHGWLFKIKP